MPHSEGDAHVSEPHPQTLAPQQSVIVEAIARRDPVLDDPKTLPDEIFDGLDEETPAEHLSKAQRKKLETDMTKQLTADNQKAAGNSYVNSLCYTHKALCCARKMRENGVDVTDWGIIPEGIDAGLKRHYSASAVRKALGRKDFLSKEKAALWVDSVEINDWIEFRSRACAEIHCHANAGWLRVGSTEVDLAQQSLHTFRHKRVHIKDGICGGKKTKLMVNIINMKDAQFQLKFVLKIYAQGITGEEVLRDIEWGLVQTQLNQCVQEAYCYRMNGALKMGLPCGKIPFNGLDAHNMMLERAGIHMVEKDGERVLVDTSILEDGMMDQICWRRNGTEHSATVMMTRDGICEKVGRFWLSEGNLVMVTEMQEDKTPWRLVQDMHACQRAILQCGLEREKMFYVWRTRELPDDSALSQKAVISEVSDMVRQMEVEHRKMVLRKGPDEAAYFDTDTVRLLCRLAEKHEVDLEPNEDISYSCLQFVFELAAVVLQVFKRKPDLLKQHFSVARITYELEVTALIASLEKSTVSANSTCQLSDSALKMAFHAIEICKDPDTRDMGAFERKALLLASIVAGPDKGLSRIDLGGTAYCIDSCALAVRPKTFGEEFVSPYQKHGLCAWVVIFKMLDAVRNAEQYHIMLADMHVAIMVAAYKIGLPVCLFQLGFADRADSKKRKMIHAKLRQQFKIQHDDLFGASLTWKTKCYTGHVRKANDLKKVNEKDGFMYGYADVERFLSAILEMVEARLPPYSHDPLLYFLLRLDESGISKFDFKVLYLNSPDVLSVMSKMLDYMLPQITRDKHKFMVRVEDTCLSTVVQTRYAKFLNTPMRNVYQDLPNNMQQIVDVLEQFAPGDNLQCYALFKEFAGSRLPYDRQRTVAQDLYMSALTRTVTMYINFEDSGDVEKCCHQESDGDDDAAEGGSSCTAKPIKRAQSRAKARKRGRSGRDGADGSSSDMHILGFSEDDMDPDDMEIWTKEVKRCRILEEQRRKQLQDEGASDASDGSTYIPGD